jgi:lipid II:glycine glycyltransferase (peptidoglycan interpeptide bridge formation enzyme)
VQANGVEARYVATSRPHRQLAPMNFLHYETIRWAASRGLGFLDLSGWATADADPKQRRINRFKAGFGGVPFEYPTFASLPTRERAATARLSSRA